MVTTLHLGITILNARETLILLYVNVYNIMLQGHYLNSLSSLTFIICTWWTNSSLDTLQLCHSTRLNFNYLLVIN